MVSQEQLMDTAYKAWDWTKTQFGTLKEAGLFKGEHVLGFSKDLAAPFDKENLTPSGFQDLILAKTRDLVRGFICGNAIVFFLEVLGSLTALLLGRPLPLFFFELVYAFVVAYVMYWLVVCSEGNEYKLVAIGLYVVYSLINLIQAMTALVLIVPALFFFAKVVASLSCAYYAFKIEKAGLSGSGHVQLKDEDDLEVTRQI